MTTGLGNSQDHQERCGMARRNSRREQYEVTRRHGTERAFSGPVQNWDNKAAGSVCTCVCCGEPLFDASGEIRFRHRLAELLRSRFRCERRSTSTVDKIDGSCAANGGAVRRNATLISGHLFPDGPKPDRPALLHERPGARLQAGGRGRVGVAIAQSHEDRLEAGRDEPAAIAIERHLVEQHAFMARRSRRSLCLATGGQLA